MECLKCKYDLFEFANFDALCENFVECPNCGNKMVVFYDESYDETSEEEYSWWWVEQYRY